MATEIFVSEKYFLSIRKSLIAIVMKIQNIIKFNIMI